MSDPYAAGAAKLKQLAEDVIAELERRGHVVVRGDRNAIDRIDGRYVRFFAHMGSNAINPEGWPIVHYDGLRRVPLREPKAGWHAKVIADKLEAALNAVTLRSIDLEKARKADDERAARVTALAREAGLSAGCIVERDWTYRVVLHGLTREQVVAVGKALEKARGEG